MPLGRFMPQGPSMTKKAALGVLIALSSTVAAIAQERPQQPVYPVAKCEHCHGAGGDSPNALTPRLNGQQPGYIVKRLKEFLQPAPKGPHAIETMSQAASDDLDNSRAALAAYFGRQKPMTAAQGALAKQGRLIYRRGIDSEGIVACQQCHGANGEGHDTVPRIAGQHSDYLRTQLWLFRFPLRGSRLMHVNTERITADQVDALVAFLGRK